MVIIKKIFLKYSKNKILINHYLKLNTVFCKCGMLHEITAVFNVKNSRTQVFNNPHQQQKLWKINN